MHDSSALWPDAAQRSLRIILVHDYPPGVHAYQLEQAFKALGHEVFTAAMGANTPGLDAPILEQHPGYAYDLLTAPGSNVNDILSAAGGGDLLLYLEPGRAFLPRDLEDCEIPTLGLLSEEVIHADWELPLYPMFDIGLTAWHAVQERYQARGLDHVWQWYYGAAPDFIRNERAERPDDFVFVGNLHPVIQRERNLVVQRVAELAREDFTIGLHSGLWFDRYSAALNRGKTTYAGSVTRQINMRVFEAMAAGVLVIVPTPADGDDPLSSAFEPGKEIVFADTADQVLHAVRHYARDEDARLAITEAAERKLQAEFSYEHVAQRFVREIVPRIPADFRERRAQRLNAFGDSPRARRLNRARFSLGLGNANAAQTTLSQSPSDEPDADWSNALGAAQAVAGDHAAAVRALATAVDLDPAHPIYASNLAAVQAHRMLLGAVAPDTTLLDTVLSLLDQTDPARPDLSAPTFWYPYQYDRPRVEIARAHTDFPPGPDRGRRLLDLLRFRLHSFAAAILARGADIEGAKRSLEAAAVILPDDGYTLDALADVLAALGQSAQANDLYQRAAALEPFHTDARVKAAHGLVQGGAYQDAVRQAENILDSTPSMSAANRAEAMALVGVAASQLGDIERARAALEDSLAVVPDQPAVRAFLDRLADAEPAAL